MPENKREVWFFFLYGVTGKQNIWHQAFLWAGDFSWFFIAQLPIQHLWRHRKSTASLNKTLPMQKDCVALNYLNSSVLLPVMDLDVSEDVEEGERMQLESSAAWFLEWQQRDVPKGRLSHFAESCCAHSCLKGKHFKSCSLCGSQTTVWWETEASKGIKSSGAICTVHQGFPACCHAAPMGQSQGKA